MKKDLLKIIYIFLTWRVLLILFLFFAITSVPLGYKDRFLGGGANLYSLSPQLFSWANFDGEHYLSIAYIGYRGLEQAFFPVYPMLISFLSKPFVNDIYSSLVFGTVVGIIISSVAFFLALIILWKTIRIDYSKNIAFLTLTALILFPTSFYFGAVYSESIFLLLSVLSFYFAKRNKWVMASIFGFIASATRIFGLLLLPALLIEAYQRRIPFKKIVWLFIIPLGLGVYMLYQNLTVGDPLAFYHLQKIVGEQHQSGLTILPQVYFRYLKMLLTVDMANPIYQTILLEFVVGIVFFLLPIYGYFKKVKLSYLFYAMVGFLLPSIQGSFSSVPRYVIVFFPSFLIIALWLEKLPQVLRLIIFLGMSIALFVETTLFLRGYWVA
ncbi:MAG: mannosyltransferase family protein [Candidatus Daviesbacteria bacterium]|nr:mannosyltransferase family protein [Candidatus Daviesbacteria bacterium]